MTSQKLYALKTSDTGEWVNYLVLRYYIDDKPLLFTEANMNTPGVAAATIIRATTDTGHPCEWVEVWVIEAKAVDSEAWRKTVSANEKKSPDEWFQFMHGFRACLRYLGVG